MAPLNKKKMATKKAPAKRGPGRPAVDREAGGDATVKLTLRIGPMHQAKLKAIAMLLGKDQASAMRWLIENTVGKTMEELIDEAGNVLPGRVLEAAANFVSRGKPASPKKWQK